MAEWKSPLSGSSLEVIEKQREEHNERVRYCTKALIEKRAASDPLPIGESGK